jgi:hypothetical protein
MPRASDVDRDMTNGERVEVKYVSYSFAGSELTVIESLVHRPISLKRLSFPPSSVCAVVPSRVWLIISYPNLDGLLHLRYSLQQYDDLLSIHDQ